MYDPIFSITLLGWYLKVGPSFPALLPPKVGED